MKRLVLLAAAAAVILAAGTVPAAAAPVYGPEVFAKIQADGTPDVYTSPFSIVKSGYYNVWVQNGDDGGGRITSGSVTLAPASGPTLNVIGPAAFGGPRELIMRTVLLGSGTWTLNVTLNEPGPGAFMSLVIAPAGDHLDLTTGRLLLPYGDSTDTTLVLRNGASRHQRFYQLHFFDATGALVATSPVQVLDPSASVSGTAASFIGTGSWTSGSIMVVWGGQGPARVFGMATTVDPGSGVKGLLPMEHAGYRNRDAYRAANQ